MSTIGLVAIEGFLPLLGTYLLLAGFLALSAHIAARNVLGDVPVQRALVVGHVPAIVPFLLQQYGGAVTVLVAVVADLLVIQMGYRLKWGTASYVTFIHVAVTTIMGVILGALLLLIATAPG